MAPSCDLRSAAEIAERVRKALSATPVVTPAGQLLITASAGVSEATFENMPEAGALIDAADRALGSADTAPACLLRMDPRRDRLL